MDGIISQELANINDFPKLILTFKEVHPYENTYDMILSSSSDNISFRYRLCLDENIHNNVKRPYVNIIIKKNTLNFKLLQGLLASQIIYNFFDSYETLNYSENDQFLKSIKQYLYTVMVLYINLLLNNLSKIY